MQVQMPSASEDRRDPRSPEFVTGFAAFLMAQQIIDEHALRRAQRAQAQSGERFDLVLTRLGLMPEAGMAAALAGYLGLPIITPDQLPSVALHKDRLSQRFLSTNRIVPVEEHDARLLVAVADPFNSDAVAALAFQLEQPVDRGLCAARDIDLAVERLYGEGGRPASAAAAEAAPHVEETAAEAGSEDVRRLEDLASEAPIIRLVQDLIVRAVEAHASDIHIEPREDRLEIRFRIDGVLHTVERLSQSSRSAVTSRIKVMAGLDIAERRMPQDGRIKAVVRGREIDLRISTMPTLIGESVVMRILDRSSVELDFDSLGFGGAGLASLTGLLQQPNGIILVTGPTGSGKTTTLYTALGMLNDEESKVFTVEDPVEYQLAGVNQVQVNHKIGLSFAHALRSILRQDPDVIMVGEIRDLETAEMAIKASLTGHLVLSTVHTNSAAATVTRLLDMGVEDYLLGSTVTGVVAQRLVRRLCEACAAPAEASAVLTGRLQKDAGAALARLDAAGSSPRLRRKVGCPACRHTGFSGRLSVNELLVVTDPVRDTILKRADERSIEAAAIAGGMATMFQDGLAKALLGITTVDEVLRATRVDR